MKILLSSFSIILFLTQGIVGQPNTTFTLKDSLRGSLNENRLYDVNYYDLYVQIDPKKKSLKGNNEIYFTATENQENIQIDLFENMKVNKIMLDNSEKKFTRIYDAIIIQAPIKKSKKYKLNVYYEGTPIVSKNPPWYGGWNWETDKNGKPWASVSCEGIGASLWWPNKDHLSDEPDSMRMHFTVPKDLMAVSNGILEKTTEEKSDTKTYHWKVSYPINNYNVTVYVGDYTHYAREYQSLDETKLACDFYVMKENLQKAQTHFLQLNKMLEAFEHYFGKYPFWNDGYGLVESSYAGMEHQGAIAYGNGYQKGYAGRVPEEFDFDYIMLHESAHEYWGNSISCNDLAEMWIHEGFATYSEALYVEYVYGQDAAIRYLTSQRSLIKNNESIIGPYGVNYENPSDADKYYKGSWMLHTLRSAIKNDELWFEILMEFSQKYKIKNITQKQFFDFVNEKTGHDYSAFFREYLKWKEIPKLEYMVRVKDNITTIKYRWNCLEQLFDLPLDLSLDKRIIRLYPDSEWKNIEFQKEFKDVFPITKNMLFEAVQLDYGK